MKDIIVEVLKNLKQLQQGRMEKNIPKNVQPILQFMSSRKDTGGWQEGRIPRLTTFKYYGRGWEVRLSRFPFMGWGLFLVDGAKKDEDLIPYTGPHLTKAEYKKVSAVDPRIKRYALQE